MVTVDNVTLKQILEYKDSTGDPCNAIFDKEKGAEAIKEIVRKINEGNLNHEYLNALKAALDRNGPILLENLKVYCSPTVKIQPNGTLLWCKTSLDGSHDCRTLVPSKRFQCSAIPHLLALAGPKNEVNDSEFALLALAEVSREIGTTQEKVACVSAAIVAQ